MINIQLFLLLLILYTIEGPILSYIGGLVSSYGGINFFLILTVSYLGNIFGDLFWYSSSRISNKIPFIKKMKNKIKSKRMNKIKWKVRENSFKTLFIAKFVPTLSVPTLIYIGNTKVVKLKRFIGYSLIISLLNSSLYTSLGYFSAVSLKAISNYLNYAKIIIPITAIILGYIFWRNLNKKEIEEEIKERI